MVDRVWIVYVFYNSDIYSIHKTREEAREANKKYKKLHIMSRCQKMIEYGVELPTIRQYEYHNGKISEIRKMIYDERMGVFIQEGVGH